MIAIKTQSHWIIIHCFFKSFKFSKCESSIVIEISFIWLKFNCLCETLNRLFVISFTVIWNSSVVICIWVFIVKFYGCWIVKNCFVKFPKFIICEPSIEKSFEMYRQYLQRLWIQTNSLLIFPIFTCLESFSMEFLSLGF